MDLVIDKLCDECRGTGKRSGPPEYDCPICNGTGRIYLSELPEILGTKFDDMVDKLNDIMDKCNDIFEKVNE